MTGTKPKGQSPSPKARPAPRNRRKRKDKGMTPRDSVAMCVKNLMRRKVRTFLTVSGVIIGTCAITVMISLGLGMQKTLDETLAQLGDLTIIQIYNYGTATETPLDDSMIDQIRAQPGVVAVTPVVEEYVSQWGNYTIASGRYTYNGQLTGVDFDALKQMGYLFDEGDFPGDGSYDGMIVFGCDALYNWTNAKGDYVAQIPDAEGNMPDPYVDVMDAKLELTINKADGNNSTKRQPEYKLTCTGIMTGDWEKNPTPNYTAFVDYKYLKSLQEAYNKYNSVKTDRDKVEAYQQVIIKVEDMNDVEDVEAYIQSFGFNTSSMESVRKPIQEQANQQQMILGSLGAISLFVAALSITNTMIMSVYERTREIGVMKVLGCSLSDIRQVFLLEAGCIGFAGGVIGVMVSYLISFIINHYGSGGGDGYYSISTTIGGSSIIPPWLALGAVAFATLVGLLSGFSPANRAVKISALTAIKQE